MIEIRVIRRTSSYLYKADPKAPDSWEVGRNDLHNMEDRFILLQNGQPLLSFAVQTVANIPGGRYLDTIAPGRMGLRWNMPMRKYQCGMVHGIVNAFDLEGQPVSLEANQPYPGKNGAPIELARTLVHDTQKCLPAAPMTLTRVAWSASCFIGKPQDHARLNELGTSLGFKKDDVIPLELVEFDF